MNFIIRTAVADDIPEIMRIMHMKPSGNTISEWYITDEEAEVRECLENKGFIMITQTETGEMAGFFIIKYPDMHENLGQYLGFTEAQLREVVLMDSVAISPEFRGNGLQGKMLMEAEKRIDKTKYHYAMCTIHPDNVYSLHNMQKHDYEVKKTIKCYGNNIRHVLLKEFK